MAAPPSSPPAPRELQRREHALVFIVLLVASAAIVLVPLWHERQRAATMVENEIRAQEVLLRLRAAEGVYRARRGRYGWLSDLAEAELLHGLVLAEQPGGWHVSTPGYRVDILLPSGHVGGENVSLVAEAEVRLVDPDLVREHFAVVARPREPGTTGWRALYVDEEGVLYLNEGIVDADGATRNALPSTQVKLSQPQQSGRTLLWQRADSLQRGD